MNSRFYRIYKYTTSSTYLSTSASRAFFNGSIFNRTYATDFTKRPDFTKESLKQHFPNVSAGDLPAAFRSNPDRAAALLTTIHQLGPKTPDDGTYFDPHSDEEGHLGALATVVDHGSDAKNRVLDRSFPLRSTFAAFPNGIELIPQDLTDDCIAASDQKAWVQQHRDVLDKFRAQVISGVKGTDFSYVGNSIILATGSVVRCTGHQVGALADGSIVHALLMETTSQHTFDGAYLWGWIHDPSRPNMVSCVGFQCGKHPWYDLDTLNVWGGVGLHHVNNRSGIDFYEAYESGQQVRTGDGNLIKDRFVRVLHACLAAADRLSPLFQWMRSEAGPNNCAEIVKIDHDVVDIIYETGIEALEDMDHLQSADNTGAEIDGQLVTIQPHIFGDAIGIPNLEQANKAFDTWTEILQSEQNYADLRKDVLHYAELHLQDDYARLSGDELLAKLLDDPKCRFDITNIVKQRLSDPIQPQLNAYIDTLKVSGEDRSAISDAVQERAMATLVTPLLTKGGALCLAIQLDTLDKQLNVLNQQELAAKIDVARSQAARDREVIEELRARIPSDEAEREEIERGIEEHEAAEKAAADDQERYEQMRSDLENADELIREREAAEREQVRERFNADESNR